MSADEMDESPTLGQAKLLVRAGNLAAAEAVLGRIAAAGDRPSGLHAMRASVLAGLGRREEALIEARAALDSAQGEGRDDPEDLMPVIRIVLSLGDGALAEARLLELEARRPDAVEAHDELAALYMKQQRWHEAAAAAERACAGDRYAPDIRYAWARSLLACGRPEVALAVIADTPAPQAPEMDRIREKLLLLESQAHDALGDEDRLLAALRRLLDLRPDEERFQARLYAALHRAGRREEARPHGQRLSGVRRARLPERLGERLLDLAREAAEVDTSSAAAKWAWELADRSIWDRRAWARALRWGASARRLLSDIWIYAPERRDEIRAMIDAPDMGEVRAVLAQGRGCVMAGAHFGPTAAAVAFLESWEAPFRAVGPAGANFVDSGDDQVLIPVGSRSAPALRTVVSELEAGTLIGVTADALSAPDVLEIAFLGRTIRLPSFAPKLIRKRGAASFWCSPVWRGDRIGIEIERLPDPVPDEPAEAWLRRWCGAYLDQAARTMRGDPRNFDLRKGLWANVDPSRSAPGKARAQTRRRLDRVGPEAVNSAQPFPELERSLA